MGNRVYMYLKAHYKIGVHVPEPLVEANHMYFESWFNSFPVENTLNLEQRVQQIPLLQTVNSLKYNL
jgi:endonuclease I